MPATTITALVGPLQRKWRFSPPMLTTGESGSIVNLSVLSRVYLQVPVTVTAAGVAYNPTSDVVAFAFPTPGAAPSAWTAGSWDTSISGGPVAQILVGPGGTVTLAKGRYTVWVKVTDNPEIPVEEVGLLNVT